MADDAYAFKFEGVEYRMAKLMLGEARAMQKVTGKTMVQIARALYEDGDADCLAALIWIARKRQEPTLKFDDVDGDLLTFEWINDEDEPDPDPEPARAEGNGQVPDPEATQLVPSVVS